MRRSIPCTKGHKEAYEPYVWIEATAKSLSVVPSDMLILSFNYMPDKIMSVRAKYLQQHLRRRDARKIKTNVKFMYIKDPE